MAQISDGCLNEDPMQGSQFQATHNRRSNFSPDRGRNRFRPLSAFLPKFFRPRSGLKIRSTMSSHYYAATTPILPVQRPILFHSISLECMCNLGRCHSIYSPRYWGCQIGCIGIDRRQMRRFWQKTHISQKALFHHDASHGIIGHETHHYNTSKTLSNPKFCAESVFDVGGVWISTVTAVYWR